MNGRQYRALMGDGRTVGVLTLSPRAVQIEMQCRSALFFGWSKYSDACKRYLARTFWNGDELRSLAEFLTDVEHDPGVDELGCRAAKSAMHWHIPVHEYIDVWTLLTRFAVEASQKCTSVVTDHLPETEDYPALVHVEGDLELGSQKSSWTRSTETWLSLLGGLPATAPAVLSVIATQAPNSFDLQNAFLDTFYSASTALRMAMINLIGHALANPEEPVRVFGLDLLKIPIIERSLERSLGYRVTRQLYKLARVDSVRVKRYAESLIRGLADQSIEETRAAARGDLRSFSESDWKRLCNVIQRAQEWFSTRPLEGFQEVQEMEGWSYSHYAHAVLMLYGAPEFPVPVERLCASLGIAVERCDFVGQFDALLVQARGLPGPIIALNSSRSSGERERFSIAHELGHAVLPWHSPKALELSVVHETARPDDDQAWAEHGRRSETEAEADRFAAYLLMPPRWFGPDSRRAEFSLHGLEELRQKYGVSLTAVAFNAIHHTLDMVAVVYTVDGRCKVRRMSETLRERVGWDVSLHDRPGRGTAAYDLGNSPHPGDRETRVISAGEWLSGRVSFEFLKESSILTFPGHVLTIIEPRDDEE